MAFLARLLLSTDHYLQSKLTSKCLLESICLSCSASLNSINGELLQIRKQVALRRLLSNSPQLPSNIEQYIKENTEVTNEHLTPEIALHLITPRCRLWSDDGTQCPLPDPFWAFYWPGGQVLTRYILDHGSEFVGKTVLDVGSGCGASSIAAKLVGAKQVIANDICQGKAICMNAELNNVRVQVDNRNLIGVTENKWDIILFGDMFYDEEFTGLIKKWICDLQNKSRTILIGDPGRIYVRQHIFEQNVQLLYKCELPANTKLENNGLSHGYVWKYKS